MTKRSILVWVMIIVFGLASMPVIGFAELSKQTGNTEVLKKKPKKKSSKKVKKKKRSSKKKKGSKRLKTSGKKKYSKKKKSSKKKYSKKKKSSKKKKYSKKSGKKKKYGKKKKGSKKRSYKRKYYAPPTNSNKVEYKNYKRNDDGQNSGQEQNIEKIAPSKEIKKEPKKEGE